MTQDFLYLLEITRFVHDVLQLEKLFLAVLMNEQCLRLCGGCTSSSGASVQNETSLSSFVDIKTYVRRQGNFEKMSAFMQKSKRRTVYPSLALYFV